MGRALIGLLKGLLVGGGVGYGLLMLGLVTGVVPYLAAGLVGALTGLVCGRAPWRAETIWTPILKMVFGLGVSVGLYALGSRYLPSLALGTPLGALALNGGPVLAPAIGGLYGLLVEVDDGGAGERDQLPGRKAQPALKEKARKQLKQIVD